MHKQITAPAGGRVQKSDGFPHRKLYCLYICQDTRTWYTSIKDKREKQGRIEGSAPEITKALPDSEGSA